MVFVPMGEGDGSYSVPILGEIRDIRDNDIHAQKFGFREHQSGIDDDDVIAPTHGHAVHSELAQAAQRYHLQFSGWHYLFLDRSTRSSGDGGPQIWRKPAAGMRPHLPALVVCMRSEEHTSE